VSKMKDAPKSGLAELVRAKKIIPAIPAINPPANKYAAGRYRC